MKRIMKLTQSEQIYKIKQWKQNVILNQTVQHGAQVEISCLKGPDGPSADIRNGEPLESSVEVARGPKKAEVYQPPPQDKSKQVDETPVWLN